MSSRDTYCVHAMDCNDSNCAKNHRISFPKRKAFNIIFNKFKQDNTVEWEDRTDRFRKCSFSALCNKSECGFNHRGFAPSTREKFREFYDDFYSISECEQQEYLNQFESEASLLRESVSKVNKDSLSPTTESFNYDSKKEIKKSSILEVTPKREVSDESSIFITKLNAAKHLLSESRASSYQYFILKYKIEDDMDMRTLAYMMGIANVSD